MKDAITYAHDAGFFSFNVIGWKAEFERLIEAVRADALAELATVKESLTDQDHIHDATKMVSDHIAGGGKVILTTEQAQQIEEALDESYAELSADSHRDGPRCLLLTTLETAIATIRAARAQEPLSTNLDGLPANLAEQEQVAVLDITYGREPECYATPNADDLPEGTYRLYAAHVRTKDLTDDEIVRVFDSIGTWKEALFGDLVLKYARAVIAADREKNK